MDSKTKIIRVGALAGVLILTQGIPAFAQDDGPREDRRAEFRAKMEQKIERMHDELGLTPEQKEKLKAHRESKMQNRRAFKEKIRAKRQALRDELQKPDFDRQKVKALHNDIKQLMNQGADERLESIMYVRDVLTPEQYKAFNEKKEEFKDRRGGKWRDKGSRGDRPDGFPHRFRGGGPDDMPDGPPEPEF